MELMHEYFPKHSHMRTARMKQDKETEEEEGKKWGMSMERSKAGIKKVALHYRYLIKIQ